MRRRVVIALTILVGLTSLLAVGYAKVGTDFDDARLDLRALREEVSTLRQRVAVLADERAILQTELNRQIGTIEQLKVELERAKSQVRQQQASAALP